MLKIMFLCTGDSCRSQIAEGFAPELGKGIIEAHSAGLSPQGVNPRGISPRILSSDRNHEKLDDNNLIINDFASPLDIRRIIK